MAPQTPTIGDGVVSVVARNWLAEHSSLYCHIPKHCTDSSLNRSCEQSPPVRAASHYAPINKANRRHQSGRVHQAQCQISVEADEAAINIIVCRSPCARSAYLLCGQRSLRSCAAELPHLCSCERISTTVSSPVATARRSRMSPGSWFKPSYSPYIPFNRTCLPRYEWVNARSFDSLLAARGEWTLTSNERRRACRTVHRAPPVAQPTATGPETLAALSGSTPEIAGARKGERHTRRGLSAVNKTTSSPFADDTIERAPSPGSLLT